MHACMHTDSTYSTVHACMETTVHTYKHTVHTYSRVPYKHKYSTAIHTYRTYSTYIQYIQQAHTVHTCIEYIRTYSTYIIHTVHRVTVHIATRQPYAFRAHAYTPSSDTHTVHTVLTVHTVHTVHTNDCAVDASCATTQQSDNIESNHQPTKQYLSLISRTCSHFCISGFCLSGCIRRFRL